MTGIGDSVRPHNRVYRRILLDEGGPWVCFLCNEEMTTLEHVHHVDHDPWNNSRENLVAMHSACHNREHHIGLVHTEDAKSRISESLKVAYLEGRHKSPWATDNGWTGRSHTEEARKKIQASALARDPVTRLHSEETKEKIRKAILGQPRVTCGLCGREMAAPGMGMHMRAHARRGE